MLCPKKMFIGERNFIYKGKNNPPVFLKFESAQVRKGAQVSARTEILHVISPLVVKPPKTR